MSAQPWWRRVAARVREMWAPAATEQGTQTDIPPPTGMSKIRKSTSLPNVLQTLRKSKTPVPLPLTLEEDDEHTTFKPPCRALTTVRCVLTTAEFEQGVKVTVQILKNLHDTQIKIFRHSKCILHLDRKLLRFVENPDRLTLAFNARSQEYDWWVLAFKRTQTADYYSLHYHVLQDASL